MAILMLSTGLVLATYLVVRPAMAEGSPLRPGRFDGRGVLAVFAAVVMLAAVLGIPLALAVLAAALVWELGHGLGHRLAGHDDARLRLLPLPGGPPVSDHPPTSDLAALFILLMGPGLGLVPMVAAFALGTAFAETAPGFSAAAHSYALAAGGLNFLALQPLSPLPGTQPARRLITARFPRLRRPGAVVLGAGLLGLALTLSSPLLFALGLIATAPAFATHRDGPARQPFTRSQARIAFTAYFAMLGIYALAGWWALKLLPLGV